MDKKKIIVSNLMMFIIDSLLVILVPSIIMISMLIITKASVLAWTLTIIAILAIIGIRIGMYFFATSSTEKLKMTEDDLKLLEYIKNYYNSLSSQVKYLLFELFVPVVIAILTIIGFCLWNNIVLNIIGLVLIIISIVTIKILQYLKYRKNYKKDETN